MRFIMANGKCGKNLTWTLNVDTLTISGTGKMDDYFYDADIVWFPSKESIKRVVIADGVTSIGSGAFYECNSLTSVTIPDSVTSIGNWAFSGCGLTSVTIPDSVTSIGEKPVYNCRSLKEIHYPAGRGFEKNLSQGNNAKLIPYNVATPVKSTTQPSKSGTCGKNLRWKLDGNGTLTISGTGKMDDYFRDAQIEWLSSKESIKRVVIADGVTSIGDWAFYECKNLTSVTIPDSVTTIGERAFGYCENLTSVTIPDSVTSIGDWAFGYCENLTSVTIPDSVTTIGKRAFIGCTSLTSVTIPDSVTSIGDSAFYCCTSLTSVTIPDSVTTIGNKAFYGCGLTSVTIPDSVTSIGDSAFSWCTSLTSVTIGNSVTSIGNWAFYECNRLTSVTIGNSVTSIGDSAFFKCERLTSVTIPDSVTTIGEEAFRECTSLTSVTIGNSVTSIGDSAFYRCKRLTSVTIPDSVTSIGNSAFGDCTSLKEIHYPAGRGFEKNLSIGNNVKMIPYNVTPPVVTKPTVQTVTRPKPTTQSVTQPKPTAQPVAEKLTWSFAGKTLTVGGVREIKFFPYGQIPWIKHLHDIQRIVVGDGVEKIAAHAFEECKRLEMVTLPASVKTIGDMFASVAYCGDRFVNGGRNVFWCLEDGVLVLKKNPVAKSDADFSTGFASWRQVTKNIKSVKVERGIVPNQNFFEWLGQLNSSVPVSF